MKKTNRILSMLLSLILLFSLMAVSASAEGEGALPIWPEDTLFIDEPVADPSSMGETYTLFSAGGPGEEGTGVIEENPDPDFAERGGEGPADTAPKCSVSLYYVDGDERKAVEDPSAMLLQNLMDPHMELMLTPSEGWYISGLDGKSACRPCEHGRLAVLFGTDRREEQSQRPRPVGQPVLFRNRLYQPIRA